MKKLLPGNLKNETKYAAPTPNINVKTNTDINKIKELELKNGTKVAAEVYPFQKFWVAEDYHQNFKKNNPNHPYILNVSNPRFKNFKFNYNQLINDN